MSALSQSIQSKSDKHEYVMIVGLILILFVRDIIGIEINKFLIAGFVALTLLKADLSSIISMLSFCFPVFCGLPGKYIITIAFILILYRSHFNLNLHQIFCIIFIVAMELVASIWYPKPDWLEIIGYMIFAILMFWMLWTKANLDYKKCLEYFLLGDTVLCGIITLAGIKAAPANWIYMFSTGLFRFGETHLEEVGDGMTLWLNPNGLAYFSIVGIAIALVLLEGSDKQHRLYYSLMLSICAITGFLTLSRSWIVCMIIIVIIYAAGRMTSFKNIVIFLTICCIVVYSMMQYFDNHPELLTGFITRFSSSDMDNADGRTDLFLQYMEAFCDNIRFQLMGTGVMQYRAVTGVQQNGMHNSTQQLLVCYGVPGFLFMVYHLFSPVLRTVKGHKFNVVYWLPLVAVVVFTQTIQFVQPYVYMPPFAVAVFALILGCSFDEKNKHFTAFGTNKAGIKE